MAKGTELAVGYISLVAETSGLTKDVEKAFGQVSRKAESHGKQMGDRMGRGASNAFKFNPGGAFDGGIKGAGDAGSKMGSKMAGALSTTLAQGLATAGIAGGLAGVAAAFTSAIRSGVDYQSGLNRIKGVTSATVEQMAQVDAKARELGADITLTGVSAQTAAEGMLELTKGGLSVEQAMQAARGTMALATAAGIEAGKAATIQADAINAFGLSANDAMKVADNLANVANASTGELTDFAYGLQMSSAVANQFGMTVDETVTSLGLLANAGVKGSDAGTLIKSMLLALASPSEPQAGAIEALGLQVWDTSGKFVGMAEILEQLHQSAMELTPEMYALYSSTAFGSDAARIAGVAARVGAQGFNELRDAVNRVGGASEVAAANTAGLPGVLERLSNTADRAKLAITDMSEGAITAIGDGLNNAINSALDMAESGAGAFGALSTLANEAWPAIKSLGAALVEAVGSLASGAWDLFATTLTNVATVADATIVPFLKFLAESGVATIIKDAAIAWGAWKVAGPILGGIHTGVGKLRDNLTGVAGPLMRFREEMQVQQSLARLNGNGVSRWASALDVLETHSPMLHSMADGYRSASTNATHFSRTLGVMGGAMAGVRHAGSAVMGMLGGPWGAALTAATIGITLWTQSVQQANQRAETLAATTDKLTLSSREMYEELSRSGGEVSDTVVSKVDEQVEALSQSMETLRRGAGAGDWLRSTVGFLGSMATGFTKMPFGDSNYANNIQATAESMERMKNTMRDLKLDNDQLNAAIRGSNEEWSRLEGELRGAGQGGAELLERLRPLRDEFLRNKSAAENLTPGIVQLQDAMKILGDETKSTADKTNALKQALDILAGKQPDLAAATSSYNETMRDVTESTKDAINVADGYGDSLRDQLKGATEWTYNGQQLYGAIIKIKDSTIEMAAAGGDLSDVFALNAIQLEALAEKYGLTKEEVTDYAARLGYLPESIATMVTLNKDEAEQQLAAIITKLDTMPTDKTLTVDAQSVVAARGKLEELGLELKDVERDGRQQVDISMNGDDVVKAKIRQILQEMTNLPSRLTIVSRVEGGGFRLSPANRPGEYLPIGPVSGRVGGGGGAGLGTAGSLPGRADGGSISGPGTSTSDSIPILASNNEHIWSAAEVAGAGGHRGVEGLRALARTGALRGLLPGFAEGGAPGDKKKRPEDVLAAYGEDGDGLTGATDIESALWYAYEQSGRPYEWSGDGTGGSSFDCSGYLSATWGVMTGRGPGRHFNTHSDFAALGFRRGYQPGAFNIGVHRGPTMDTSHMAGTMPDGSHVESGSSGVTYDGSVGALDPQFDEHWYYPISADDPAVQALRAAGWGAAGDGGNTTYSTGGAGGGFSQSDAAAMGYGSPAGPDMARTEGWVPAGAGNTGVAGTSFAAGLLGMGAEAINGLIDQGAQAASSAVAAGVAAGTMGAGAAGAPAAGAAANFAIGLGTQAAKRGVSYGFQMASIGLDALVEQMTPLGAPRWLGYDYTSLVPQIGMQPAPTTSVEDALQSQQDVGASREGRISDAVGSMSQTASAEQRAMPHGLLSGQQPGAAAVPPGSDPWGTTGPVNAAGAAKSQQTQDQDWLRRLGVYDEGGMLPPGGVGINLSNQPEPVLTNDQWGVLTRATETLQTRTGTGNDYSIRIDNLQVQDVAALQRELDSRQKLQMMRFAGRP